MKKVFILTLALATLIAASSFAEESYVSGGFEASGNIVAGAGWERFKTTGGNLIPADVSATDQGVIGAYMNSSGTVRGINREDNFKFFVDQVELDLAKSFGENIRFRADLDFGSKTMNSGPRFGIGAAGADVGVVIEQAYTTANLSLGNGLEILLGRFNAPIGFEKVDVVYNDTISRSTIYRALRPNTFTGLKMYYAFSDLVDWNIYIANSGLLPTDDGDVLNTNTDIPAFGTRLGFNWGEEGKKSALGFSGAVGQDHPTVPSGQKKRLSFLGDVDWQWWATDNFAFGGEGIYRQIDNTIAGVKNGKYFGALANFRYNFSDVWDGTLKYAFTYDVNGNAYANDLVTPVFAGVAQSLTGAKQKIHELTLAGNYAIADGAKLKLEGGYTVEVPVTGIPNRHIFGLGGAFAYEF